ncbi:hypothetical protein EhVM1_000066 [Emiliania huxleyi virus M1]|nr:hypothetical protein EhVM1_000066 [Emiliania huxleyi virus M1]
MSKCFDTHLSILVVVFVIQAAIIVKTSGNSN